MLQQDEDADGAGQGAPDRVKAAKSSRLEKDIPDLASREKHLLCTQNKDN